jgi:hypothetical protein
MESEKTQKLIRQIGLLLQENDNGSGEFLRQTLEKINTRLDLIELQLQSSTSKVQSPKSLHPSQDKFILIEELVDEIIVNQKIEKACMFETNKPCDNCSMCNSRGF